MFSGTPVAEKAKRGRTTKADQGAAARSMRSAGDDSRSLAAVRLRLAPLPDRLLIDGRFFAGGGARLGLGVLEFRQRGGGRGQERAGGRRRPRGQEGGQDHAGKGGVAPGGVKRQPETDGGRQIGPAGVDAPAV